jgi:ribosomal-protein-alanine N-acetyltransferase
MITDVTVALATLNDATSIAEMSREHIEQGLPWRWTEPRVARSIQDPEVNVAVVRGPQGLVAFGIMSYRSDDAHLLLFAVRRSHQRQKIGSALLRWLEAVAVEAGIKRVLLEARRDNVAARNFYAEHGYHEQELAKGLYLGVADGVRFAKWLVPGA